MGPTFYANNADRGNLAQTDIYPQYLPKDYSGNDYEEKASYELSFKNGSPTANTYTIVATAQGAQALADADCNPLTLDHLGIVNKPECWE